MRRLMTLLTAAVLVLAAAAPAVRADGRALTILFYICGSDLESENGEATRDIREMIASGIGASGDVSVLLATGGASRWQQYGISGGSVQYYRLGAGAPELLRDAGRRSMGDAGTLSDFLRYGMSAAPADRTMLVLWDHGGGPIFGLCNDENHGDDALTLDELKAGLRAGLNGTKLDVIAFDCCLMNCLDLCGALAGLADYAVLSQEMVSGTGLDYDGWMKPLAADPDLPAEKIALSMAETYVAENEKGRSPETATMSVIDLGKIPAVLDAAEAFSASLAALVRTNLSGVIRVRNRLTSFGEFLDSDASDLLDIEDMCGAFSALLPAECEALRLAARAAVLGNYATGDIAAYAHGLSFFMPFDTVRSDSREILAWYGGQAGAYADLAVAMTSQVSASGYTMAAASATPTSFYFHDEGSVHTGSLCDIWNGYYGATCSFDEAYESSGGNIWAGLHTGGGSIWAGLEGPAATPEPAGGGIWAGLPAAEPAPPAALDNIWAGLLNPGTDYYQPGEQNQNVQADVSEAASPAEVLEAADAYFSSSALTAQIIYSLQLNKADLDHLSMASGVLIMRDGDEQVRLGNLGQTTIDWSTGLVFSMFDGSWPMLENRMVRAEYLYDDGKGNVRFVIPARVNGLRMYLLGSRMADGAAELLGATQGYDENGFAIRGCVPLEPGMTIAPVFTAVTPDGAEREYQGPAVTVPAEGLALTWDRVPAGSYLYCFGLTDLSGTVHYTDTAAISF